MDAELPSPSPQERLEQTRQAIAEQLARKLGSSIHTPEASFQPAAPLEVEPGLLGKSQRVVQAWWRSHPLHNAMDLAQPLVEDYARHKPLQLIGMAAGVGATLVLLRSWRVLSATGLLLALAKTSDIRSTARQIMGWGTEPLDTPATPTTSNSTSTS